MWRLGGASPRSGRGGAVFATGRRNTDDVADLDVLPVPEGEAAVVGALDLVDVDLDVAEGPELSGN